MANRSWSVERACACGAALKVYGLEAERPFAARLEAMWEDEHSGLGHEPVSNFEAREIRAAERWRRVPA